MNNVPPLPALHKDNTDHTPERPEVYTNMPDPTKETPRCSQCKKEHFVTDFYVSRLGKRYKTCGWCCDKNRDKSAHYQANKAGDIVDTEHGKISVRDGELINHEALKHGFKMIDTTDYKNAKTHTMWECLSCGKHIRRQWQWIRKEDTCGGVDHRRDTHAKLVADTRKEFLASLGMA